MKSNDNEVMRSGYVRVEDNETTSATGLSKHDFLWEHTPSGQRITMTFEKPVLDEDEPNCCGEDTEATCNCNCDETAWVDANTEPAEYPNTAMIYGQAAEEMMTQRDDKESSEIIFLYKLKDDQNWTDLRQVAVAAKRGGEYFNVNIVTTDDAVFYKRVPTDYLTVGLRKELEKCGVDEEILIMYDRIINLYTSNRKR